MRLEFLHLSLNAGLLSGGLWRFVIRYDVAVSMRWRSASRLLLLCEIGSAYSSMIRMHAYWLA